MHEFAAVDDMVVGEQFRKVPAIVPGELGRPCAT